ncbi:MAG: tRNA (adenosine(37)-N6)-dimethylallyltransferase MiaA [Thermomicrobiales bacterium]
MNAAQDAAQTAASRPRKGPLLVIVGPTGSGKTRLAVEMALRLDGEVVNADSRYLYRGLDIGVSKPTLAELRGVPHHLIDICDPADEMSLANYQDRAYAAIDAILGRGRVPLLVGGTPLYVNAVVEGWRIPRVPPNREFRARLEREAEERGAAVLTARLAAVDPIAAERSGRNLRRVIRALEIHHETGAPMSALEGKGPPPYAALELGLTLPRPLLHQATDARVDAQIAAGLVDEVRGLLAGGLAPDSPAMSSIGYRQLLPHLSGDATLDEAAVQIKTDMRRYVRHQETWLRRNPRIVPIDATLPDWIDAAIARAERFLRDPEG